MTSKLIEQTIAAISAGAITASLLITYKESIEQVQPVLEMLVTYQEEMVETAEYLGMSNAPLLRAEWENRKLLISERIGNLSEISNNLGE